MSVDWEDEGGFSCGGAVTASKKLKKGDGGLEKQEDAKPAPRIPKSLLFVPPSRRPKKTQRLRPEKWKAAFDLEGRPVGFHKLLKIIRKGGVDNSIRAEVWEFLLGCYELGTTLAYRELVRQARRERYNELLEECRMMHSSVGTGSLAYTVGSKLMDVRVASNDNDRKRDAPIVETSPVGDFKEQSGGQSVMDQSRSSDTAAVDRATSDTCEASLKEGPDSQKMRTNSGSESENLNSIIRGERTEPVLLGKTKQEGISSSDDLRLQEPLPGEVDSFATAQLEQKPGAGLIKKETPVAVDEKLVEGVDYVQDKDDLEKAQSSVSSHPMKSISSNPVINEVEDSALRDMDVEGQKEEDVRDSGFIKSVDLDSVPGPRLSGQAERVTDWLWTLHRIVVDVVRTDKHLEFFNEGKNSARMSDILAVYAWVDPATGYCQGMSDLLSPFIVLFDIDADAFWCFESLLKRVRDNFQMEGPIRVMKQLDAMSKILEVTDADMLKHLVLVGADNFLFAFRMLLVLFRRELSFPEALYMWEMMWAADFHQATAWSFEYHSLEALRLPNFDSPAKIYPFEEESTCKPSSPEQLTPPTSPERLNTSGSPSFDPLRWRALTKRRSFCGLRPGRLWQMNRNRFNSTNVGLLGPDGDQDISVFCVAAILEQNRTMLLEKLQSMDDAIKIFNNMEMEFKVHSCVNTAVKLRKRYQNQSSKRVSLERRSIARHAQSL
ncbi:hypothetical protein M758_9G135600 [Ceratodon purpureus]|nr:hypothetical protein M758_9G135600 [Ceratodon purpureus]